jgi:hypothetical protein
MKENFIITPGNLDYNTDIDNVNIYQFRQDTAYALILFGALLMLIAIYL